MLLMVQKKESCGCEMRGQLSNGSILSTDTFFGVRLWAIPWPACPPSITHTLGHHSPLQRIRQGTCPTVRMTVVFLPTVYSYPDPLYPNIPTLSFLVSASPNRFTSRRWTVCKRPLDMRASEVCKRVSSPPSSKSRPKTFSVSVSMIPS